MRGPWCQNPESLKPAPEIAFYADYCIDCGKCDDLCEAITTGPERINRDLCNDCGDCARACPANALRMIGECRTVEQIEHACRQDEAFYETTGGGVTLSGGEPLLQHAFISELLPALSGLHVLLQTAGNYPWSWLEPLLPGLDAVYFDLKVAPEDYARLTGGTGERIVDNLTRLVAAHPNVTVRMPVVPTMNTTEASLKGIAQALHRAGVSQIQLLTYHGLWEAKLPRLNTRQTPLHLSQPADFPRVVSAFAEHGIRAFTGANHETTTA